jgi:pantoate--beta-alanine ligase
VVGLDVGIVRSVADLRAQTKEWRQQGQTITLVPTMGSLHDGHLSLMQQGREMCDRVVASIFVNPRQFAPNEDFATYPRDEAADLAKLAEIGVDLCFAPEVTEMYTEGAATTVSVAGLTDCLCAVSRPGFFDGVATVVAKLLLQALPDVALFGEKDYQQLLVIKRFVRDLNIPVRIEGGATVREADGLALSSRNAYLDPDQRMKAATLFAALTDAAKAIREGSGPRDAAVASALNRIETTGFDPIDYLECRDAETLALNPQPDRPSRLFAAAWLGNTRLIDNLAI